MTIKTTPVAALEGPTAPLDASVAVIGAGDFIGTAIARRFAAGGYAVFAGRHNGEKLQPLVGDIEAAGGRCAGRTLDARDEAAVTAFLAEADAAAPLDLVIFNVGANVNFPILDTTERVFRKVWEMACYSGFLAGREAARLMLPRGRGSIFFTGATASLRGGTGFAAFASAKFGLRALAQSLARELGPQGLHVAHLIIDSGVDTAWVREMRARRTGEAEPPPDVLMAPASIAETYWQLHHQSRDAWTMSWTCGPLARAGEMTVVDFLFDFGSPNAYLAHRVIPAMEARTGARFRYTPILLGGIFKATGNRSPMEAFAGVPAKTAFMEVETRRFLTRHAITDYRMNPHFPVNTLALMRGAIAAERDGCFSRYVDVIFHNMWSEPKKLDDPAVLTAVLDDNGFDAAKLLARAQEPEVKAALIANTDAAVAQGAFGSPTFFVGEDMFFGKDQLRDVEEVILNRARRS